MDQGEQVIRFVRIDFEIGIAADPKRVGTQDLDPREQGFEVTDGNLLFTNLLVVGVAVVIGAIGSAVAVSRFLDV